MEEKSHIINILKKVESNLNKKNYLEIKNLSNQLIHQSSINQDPDIISLAVILYSLSKLLEREEYKKQKNWDSFYSKYVKSISNARISLEKNDLDYFRKEILFIRELIQGLSGKLKEYIQEVFRKAQINKASKIYEHGISMEKTAKILGITIWELAEYAGTKVQDTNLALTMPIDKRIKIAEEVFK